jgi:hypothetical protein
VVVLTKKQGEDINLLFDSLRKVNSSCSYKVDSLVKLKSLVDTLVFRDTLIQRDTITKVVTKTIVKNEPIQSRWAVGLNVGALSVIGDMTTSISLLNQMIGTNGSSIFAIYKLDKNWGIRGQFLYGLIRGKKEDWLKQSFNAGYYSGQLSLVYNTPPILKDKLEFGIVLGQGVSISKYYRSTFNNPNYPTLPLRNGVYTVFNSIGGEINFKLTESSKLNVGTQLKTYFTDKLDAFQNTGEGDAMQYTYLGLVYFLNKN